MDTLLFGDYTAEVDGHRLPIVVERKSLPDLFATMTRGYTRFRQELFLARESQVKMLLGVEASLLVVYDGIPYSDFSGASCVQKVFTLWLKYGLQPVFCSTPYELARFLEELFHAMARTYVKETPNVGSPQGYPATLPTASPEPD